VRVFVAAAPLGLTWQLRRSALLSAFRGAGYDVSQRASRRAVFPLDRRAHDFDVTALFGPETPQVPARVVVRDVGDAPDLAADADLVVCAGEHACARYREGGTPAIVAPTVVDCDVFAPLLRPRPLDAVPRLGWLAGAEGAAALEPLRAMLGRLGHHVRYALDVSGAGSRVRVPGVVVRHRPAPSLGELAAVLQSVDALLVTPGADAAAAALVAAAAGVVPLLFRPPDADPAGLADREVGRIGQRVAGADEFVRVASALLRDPEHRAERSVRARAWVVGERRLNACVPRIVEDLRARAAGWARA